MADRFFCIRHGERVDLSNPKWVEDALRPADSPLTDNGKAMGKILGQYLANDRKEDFSVDDIVVLASPLIRCVETAEAIIEGLGKRVPIYIEESLCESMDWVYKDLARRPEFAARPMMMKPLYLSAAEHHEQTSKLVDPSYQTCHKPTPYLSHSGALTEDNTEARCGQGKDLVNKIPEFKGKTVLLVCHGGTSWFWYCALSGYERGDWWCPVYTAFSEVERKDVAEKRIGGRHRVQKPAASTPKAKEVINVDEDEEGDRTPSPAVEGVQHSPLRDPLNGRRSEEYVTRGPIFDVPHLRPHPNLMKLLNF